MEVASNLQRTGLVGRRANSEKERRVKDIRARSDGLHWTYIRL